MEIPRWFRTIAEDIENLFPNHGNPLDSDDDSSSSDGSDSSSGQDQPDDDDGNGDGERFRDSPPENSAPPDSFGEPCVHEE